MFPIRFNYWKRWVTSANEFEHAGRSLSSSVSRLRETYDRKPSASTSYFRGRSPYCNTPSVSSDRECCNCGARNTCDLIALTLGRLLGSPRTPLVPPQAPTAQVRRMVEVRGATDVQSLPCVRRGPRTVGPQRDDVVVVSPPTAVGEVSIRRVLVIVPVVLHTTVVVIILRPLIPETIIVAK